MIEDGTAALPASITGLVEKASITTILFFFIRNY
jgi:hypothetical protein